MKAPAKLSADGKAAFSRAAQHVGSRPDAELLTDAVERYAWAVHISSAARKAWIAEGQPTLATNANGAEYEHPLMKSVRESDRHAAAMAAALCLDVKTSPGAKKMGRPVGAASAPDRVAEPPRLRAV